MNALNEAPAARAMALDKGTFVVSIDLELTWGVWD